VVSALGELERRAVLRQTDERYDFAHDLIRLAAYRRIARPQRRIMHGRVAAVLSVRAEREAGLSVDVARHADLGGDASLCVQASLRACEECLQVFAYRETEALVELARRHAGRLPDRERVSAQMRCFSFLVHPGVKLHQPGPMGAQIAELCAEASDLGLNAACSLGFRLLANLYHHAFGDVPRARSAVTRAVQILETLPAEPNLEPLTDAAYCLAFLEIDMPRTRALFENLSRTRGVEVLLGYQWGIGLVHLWDGELDGAREALRRANSLAARSKKKWAEFDTLAGVAMVELEAKNVAAVLELAPELERIASKLGDDGSEGPLARGLPALARLERGDSDASREVDEAVRGLARVDSCYHLAYVQNAAAAVDLRAGRLGEARRRAEAAMRAAESVERAAEVARSELLLAAIDSREGRPEAAKRLLGSARQPQWASLPRRTRDILPLLDGS
jgi:hypothetical protein